MKQPYQIPQDPLHPKTGFQARYMDPVYRRLVLDKEEDELEEVMRKDTRSKDNSNENSEEKTSTENKNIQKLDDLVEKTKPLIKIKTVFPFVIFTNEVIIDPNKVTIIYRNFFASEQIHSVSIKDISDVLIETSIFFATLKIIDIGFTENSIDVTYLKKTEAARARRVIQGLSMANKNNVDLTAVDQDSLLEKLEGLGSSQRKSI